MLGIFFNLALLGYYKYFDFFIENLNYLSGTQLTLHNIILPLAISFFTLQQIAFLVDSFEGIVKEKSFVNYAMFVTFFPQLIAGPIVHHKEMMPQFKTKSLAFIPARGGSQRIPMKNIQEFSLVPQTDKSGSKRWKVLHFRKGKIQKIKNTLAERNVYPQSLWISVFG